MSQTATPRASLAKRDLKFDGYYLHSKKLGEGGFGKVYLATHLKTSEKVAIKVMNKTKLGADLPRVRTEIETLKILNHPNIAKLLQVFETDETISLVLEHCSGGELFDYLITKRRLQEAEVREIIADLFLVLRYIHSKGFAHRDLKPENILFDGQQKIKLIDFGLAANANANIMRLNALETCCGSPAYAAPELLRGEVYSGPAVDVWSSGVLLYSLLVGSLPFDDNHIPNLYKKIQTGIFNMPLWLSGDVRDLISSMLKTNPRERISVDGVLNHRWLRKDPVVAKKLASVPDQFGVDEEALSIAARFFPELTEAQFREKISDFGYHAATYLLLKDSDSNKRAAEEKLKKYARFMPTPGSSRVTTGSTENRVAAIKRKLELDTVNPENSPLSPVKRSREDDAKRFGAKLLDNNAIASQIAKRRVAPKIPLCATPELASRFRPISKPVSTPKPLNLPNSPVTKISDRTARKIVSPKLRVNPATPTRNPAAIKSPLRDVGNQVNSPRTPNTMQTPSKLPARKHVLKASSSKKSLFQRIIASATPSKSKEPRKMTASNLTNNITMTTFQDPNECLDKLKQTLGSRGVECKQKDFTLKCLFDDKIHTRLRFELEVCTFNGLCVIHRKRLQGDSWNYKKICEMILVLSNEKQLELLDPDSAKASMSSIENRPPVTFLVSTDL